MHPDYPNQESSATGKRQTAEETDRCIQNLELIKQKLGLETVPTVMLLDRNQEVILPDVSSDLMSLHPEMARQLWIEMLIERNTKSTKRA